MVMMEVVSGMSAMTAEVVEPKVVMAMPMTVPMFRSRRRRGVLVHIATGTDCITAGRCRASRAAGMREHVDGLSVTGGEKHARDDEREACNLYYTIMLHIRLLILCFEMVELNIYWVNQSHIF